MNRASAILKRRLPVTRASHHSFLSSPSAPLNGLYTNSLPHSSPQPRLQHHPKPSNSYSPCLQSVWQSWRLLPHLRLRRRSRRMSCQSCARECCLHGASLNHTLNARHHRRHGIWIVCFAIDASSLLDARAPVRNRYRSGLPVRHVGYACDELLGGHNSGSCAEQYRERCLAVLFGERSKFGRRLRSDSLDGRDLANLHRVRVDYIGSYRRIRVPDRGSPPVHHEVLPGFVARGLARPCEDRRRSRPRFECDSKSLSRLSRFAFRILFGLY